MDRLRRKGEKKLPGISATKSLVLKDQEIWEKNRLASSGVVEDTKPDEEDDDSTERLSIMVHFIKPPFLDGRIAFSTQKQMVSIVKDATSDFAKLSKAGSALVRENVIKKEQNKGRKRFWELNGSKMGNLLGVKKIENAEDQEDEQLVEGKFRDGAKYADHMTKSVAVSDFAKQHTIQEQREFLPVFSVKDELLNVIRDNQIVVVVGETGSGKTTQLTQYILFII